MGSKLERLPLKADRQPAVAAALERQIVALLASQLLEDGPAACIMGSNGELIYSNKAFQRIKRALAAVGALPGDTRGGPGGAESEERSKFTLLRDGRREHYRLERRCLNCEAGRAEALIYQPTTSQEAASAALTQATTRLQDITRLVSDWIWETDRNLAFSYISPRITEILGFHPRELEGSALVDLPTEPSERLAQVVETKGRSPFRNIEVQMVGITGERHVFRLSGLPVYHPENGAFIGLRGTAENVTDLRRREEALIKAKEAAELANRTKTEFLANMSHELRTPLNAVIGFSEIMERELLGPLGNEQYKSYANDIHSSAHHLLKIINDILDVAKIEAGGHTLCEEEFDPRGVLEAGARLIAERCQRARQQLKFDLPETLPLLFADERMVKQVLLNLLSNATKFTPEEGNIELTANVEADGSFIFVVKDSGIGIAASDLERAFAPFQQIDSRLSRQYEGTGLGLPLSRGFMRLHDGDLVLESTPGLGTLAIARLPAGRVSPAG